jgi:hypothetical protein
MIQGHDFVAGLRAATCLTELVLAPKLAMPGDPVSSSRNGGIGRPSGASFHVLVLAIVIL